jgi:hypothetical protein
VFPLTRRAPVCLFIIEQIVRILHNSNLNGGAESTGETKSDASKMKAAHMNRREPSARNARQKFVQCRAVSEIVAEFHL